MTGNFNATEELITAMASGKMVILLDDEKRENEGDLIMVAEKVTAAAVNFMATYARGLICLAMTEKKCHRLKLPLMVPSTNNSTAQRTNFTISIDAKDGITTGISAADRARTIRVAAQPDATAEKLVRPGHLFPIMAQSEGVLSRAGHTEAASDLARLAGFEPTATLVEIMNPDGSMARAAELHRFARTHKLKIGTIADLVAFRLQQEVGSPQQSPKQGIP